jgi:hypothetical protein
VRLGVDDEVYRVDSVWLGPRQATLPWRARYVAYGVGLLVFVGLQILERRVGIPLSFWVVMWSLLGTVAITRGLLRLIDEERPLTATLAAIANEIGAPRADRRRRSYTLRPGHVPVQPLPDPLVGTRRRTTHHQRRS